MRQALYILGQLTDDDVEWMIQNGRRHAARTGDVLIREGEPVRSLFVLLDGLVAIERGGKRINTSQPGEFLGELSFVDSRPPSATVKAARASSLLELPRDVLVRHLGEDLGFASRFYRAVAVFLADRVRAEIGGGHDPDELDPDVLDEVSRAGERFTRILQRFQRA